jgi:hypothetical protein
MAVKGVVNPVKPNFCHFEMYFMSKTDVQFG